MTRSRMTLLCALLAAGLAQAAPIVALRSAAELGKADPRAKYWDSIPVEKVGLIGQPMAIPRPETTQTAVVAVQALHDGKRLALRLRWRDSDRSEAGRLGEFSDAAAVQFPVKNPAQPPPVMMGAKGDPVHIFHWRAQYQRDAEKGKPSIKDIYPNQAIDMYPMEFADPGSTTVDEAARERFSPGRALGNPQAFPKNGVDEILAEGFSTSAVQEGHASEGRATWENGEWTLVITRPLAVEGGSSVGVGQPSHVGFAVWQGGVGEVGSRKCVTMVWTPLQLADK